MAWQRGTWPVPRVGHLMCLCTILRQRSPIHELLRERGLHLRHPVSEAASRRSVTNGRVDPRPVGALARIERWHDHSVVSRIEACTRTSLGLLTVRGECICLEMAGSKTGQRVSAEGSNLLGWQPVLKHNHASSLDFLYRPRRQQTFTHLRRHNGLPPCCLGAQHASCARNDMAPRPDWWL